MLNRAEIMALIPHQGQSCLLDGLHHWDDGGIHCFADNHLLADHPLRHGGRLHPVCGAEYGLQAAALHGALRGGEKARAGMMISLRGLDWHTVRLDNAAHGRMVIAATCESEGAGGHLYHFRLLAAHGACLVEGRGLVALR